MLTLNPWEQTLSIITKKVDSRIFNSWFKQIKFISFSDNTLSLGVPSRFFCNWIKEHYLDLIKEALLDINKKEVLLNFLITTSCYKNHPPLAEHPSSQPRLNKRYIFDNFIVGESNHLAHAASLAVAESPSRAYNPLFIYGGAGLGKTHLMQAIGHFIREKKNGVRISYMSTEAFFNQFVRAIQNRTMQDFRDKYRNTDAFLLDDVHFLIGKESAQEEIFHTFNTLHDSYKQIVFSSDRHPKEIPTLHERLLSRFEWGLVVDIQQPTLEVRIAILKKLIDEKGVPFPNEAIVFIASQIKSNIRRLEGALTRVFAHAALTKTTINLKLTEDVLGDILFKNKITMELVKESVAEFYGLKTSDLQDKKKNKEVVFPRQIAMFLIRDLTDYSFPEIGDSFGHRDHTTVIHACKKIKEEIKNNTIMKHNIERIRKKIEN
ncbi:chromosomal replication initiator protein DnaA [candidate division NPL-UPA2 bacterium Unc8]|uniref:Chromosomal replication initiator protein DnaA n=1 Tax=candidate division NPL-UPA2 bacterium Unc8 TaxID=1980939 RepID=A0A399G0C7_UNCN2|nr:MAG: chromosomal replication initiator protein DnaA [candidate division NPL-UPA2 bacterium Unc8]